MIRFQSRSIPMLPLQASATAGQVAADPIFAGLLQFLGVGGTDTGNLVDPRSGQTSEAMLSDLLAMGRPAADARPEDPALTGDPLADAMAALTASANPAAAVPAAAPPLGGPSPQSQRESAPAAEPIGTVGATPRASAPMELPALLTAGTGGMLPQPMRFDAELSGPVARVTVPAKSDGSKGQQPALLAAKSQTPSPAADGSARVEAPPAESPASTLTHMLGSESAPSAAASTVRAEGAPRVPAASETTGAQTPALPVAEALRPPDVAHRQDAAAGTSMADISPARLVSQVSGPIHYAAVNSVNAQAITVHLTPPALGRVEVSVASRPGPTRKVDVVIRVEKSETGTLLQSHLPLLRESLANQGIDVHGLSLDLTPQDQRQTPSQSAMDNPREQPRRQPDAETAESVPSPNRASGGRLAFASASRRLSLVV